MIVLDGRGGGQMLRTALELSAVSGLPFRIENIRASRDNPGLKAQHLTAIKAVQKLCSAVVEGAELGSSTLTFYPKLLKGGNVELDVGTAGSISLVLQAAIIPALFGLRQTRFLIAGGTDVPFSPSIDYFTEVFVPHIRMWCESVTVRVLKRGYFPVGGGLVEVVVKPKVYRDDYETFEQFLDALRVSVPALENVHLGHPVLINGLSHASQDLEGVAERQAHAAQNVLSKRGDVHIRSELVKSVSPGSGITLWALYSLTPDELEISRPIRLGVSALGEKSIAAEAVGKKAALELLDLIDFGAPVDVHLADQLVPLVGLRGGQYRTSLISEHTKANMIVVNQFVPEVKVEGMIVKKSQPT
ncbi:RNA 3'-terminal phosphate cyclase [Candidatus Woesearchaeota archaeon]|nr:RNA 3'-terminal phosphate cyclase [Candidatus Woesearchaeota archaeon]